MANRACKRKVKEKTVSRVVALARGKYRGFNDHHLTEKLKEHEQIELSREKIRRILRSHGIATPGVGEFAVMLEQIALEDGLSLLKRFGFGQPQFADQAVLESSPQSFGPSLGLWRAG